MFIKTHWHYIFEIEFNAEICAIKLGVSDFLGIFQDIRKESGGNEVRVWVKIDICLFDNQHLLISLISNHIYCSDFMF